MATRKVNKNGDLHRTDGPAYENSGYIEWWIDGLLHREDGPARLFSDGTGWYYLDGKSYSKGDWEIKKLKWLDHRGFPMSANKLYKDEKY
jgi:hypothetical protein